MIEVYSIAEVINDSNKRPEKKYGKEKFNK